MSKRDIAVVGLNAALLVGLCVLLGVERISWEQFLVGLGLLGAPSVASVLRGRGPEPAEEPAPVTERSIIRSKDVN